MGTPVYDPSTNTATCDCMEGCFGDGCDVVCQGFPDCCAGMGTPVYDPSTDTATCDCMEGCYGVDCSLFTCPNDCSGMGTCDSTTGSCTCMEGCFGDDCSAVCPGFPDCCADMGTPVYDPSTNTTTCDC